MSIERAIGVLVVCLVCASNNAWGQSCTQVYETKNFCFDMMSMATSTIVTLSCPLGYIVRIRSANIFKNVGSASCPMPSPATGPNTCSMQGATNDFLQQLLSTCFMQSQCALNAVIPNPSVSNCSGLTGVTYAQVNYRCEAWQNRGGPAGALAMSSNTSFTGSLINIDSAAMALGSFFVGSINGWCQLTVPAGVEMYMQMAVFVKQNPAAMGTCNQHIHVTAEGVFAAPQVMCSMTQAPLHFPCVGTDMTYDISYVTDDPSALVVFVVQVYVNHTQSVSIYCGAPVPATTMPSPPTTTSTATTTSTVTTTTTSRPVVIPTTTVRTTVLAPVGSSMQWPMPIVIGIVVGACALILILIILCACFCRRRRAQRKVVKQQQQQVELRQNLQPLPPVGGPKQGNQVIVTRTDILRDANPASKPQGQSIPLGPATAYTDSMYGGGAGFGSPSSLLGLPQQQQPVSYMANAASMPNLLTVRDYTPYTDQGYASSSATAMLAGAASIPYGMNIYQSTPDASHSQPGVNHLRPTTVVVAGDPTGQAHRPGDVSYPPVGRPGSTVVYQ